jgi:threonine synthase
MSWVLVCQACGTTIEPVEPHWRCPECSGELSITGLDALGASPRKGAGLWRWSDVLPVTPPSLGTILGEGDTPLAPVEIDGVTIFLKLDSQLPTGSFKDRGAAVLARYLVEHGRNRIIVDSSGNAAAAMAAYSAAVGLKCTVFVPASASPAKLLQARAVGATVVPVDGSRSDVAKAAQSAADNDERASYASHNWHPVFVEGVKTWALEVLEQLGGRAPDVAFIPTGGGSAFVGAWRGFRAENRDMPRLIACQPAACAPIVTAWESGSEIVEAEQGETIAEGARIALPSRPSQIRQALDESDGAAAAVDDASLRDTLRLLWRRGFYVEPTGALGVAVCRSWIARGAIRPGDVVVAHVTGHGMKSTSINQAVLDEADEAS